MPVVIVINDTSVPRPELQNVQVMVPLRAGESIDTVDMKKIPASSAVPVKSGEGNAVRWSFNGTERIARRGQKLHLPADHCEWLMGHFAGLIKIIDESDDGADAVSILQDQNTTLRRERDAAVTAAEDANRRLIAVQPQIDNVERRNSQLAYEKEQALSDASRATQEANALRAQLQKLETSKGTVSTATLQDIKGLQDKADALGRYVKALEDVVKPNQLKAIQAKAGVQAVSAPVNTDAPVADTEATLAASKTEQDELDDVERQLADKAGSKA